MSHHHFELFVAVLILGNSLVVCFECQYSGIQVGYDLRYKNYAKPADETWQGGEAVFAAFDWIFGVLFFFEVVLKVIAQTWHYFMEAWNWLDFACVLAWMVV